MMEPGVSPRPRFRQDLIAEPIDDAADAQARFIDVMNPDSGHVFRFYEVEYSLACGMDGERDVTGIVKWAKDELGLTASMREVEAVIATLNELGYLEPGTAVATAPAAEPKRVVAPVESAPASTSTRAPRQPKPAAPAEVAPTSAAAAGSAPKSGDRAAAASDFELGHAGPPPSSADAPMVPAPDIELGSGVFVAAQPVAASPPAGDIALGHVGRSDTDTKAATRSAQGISEFDTPTVEGGIELAASRPEERPTRHPTNPQPAPYPSQRAARTSDRPVGPEAPAVRASEPSIPPPAIAPEPAIPPAAAAQPTAVPAVEQRRPAEPARARSDSWRGSQQLPPRPIEAEPPRPPAEPPEQPRVSRSVVALLAAAIVAAVAFVTYKIAVKKSADHWEPVVAPDPAPEPTPMPEPPPVEVQKLDTSPEMIESIKSPTAGVIEKINETVVARGDVIVEFAGHKRLASEIASLEREIEKRVKPAVDAALKDRDAAEAAGAQGKLAAAEKRLADRQRSLNQKQTKLAAKRVELEKLEVKAPAGGSVAAQVAPGAKVTSADEIAKLTHTSKRVVTFKDAGGSPTVRVFLVSKASGRRLRCVVAKVGADGTTIECPLDVAPESTEVTYGGIDTTPENETNVPDNADIQIDPVVPDRASPVSGGAGASSGGTAAPAAPAASAAPAAPTAPAPSQAAAPVEESSTAGSGDTSVPPSSSPAPSGSPADPSAPQPADPSSESPSPPAKPGP